ncbi:Protein-export membrane protein SecG [Buchnera aphidicola (Cinara pseudotaxifoliae)]|uniref:Protein-export membrane protein SecG n=1 Tax=Buchnera aphidicola (Cinara pseudotaxifoliae) TaxID=655384 RepID=A0A451DHA4_9GAMM|nr:preprotein translocase subunit SecG [Buchnera aphidicola]VFP85992.1 Protein-export membrane protein SecG [Buchnera aphidicola (Cinara pseudotaxifoliae)]
MHIFLLTVFIFVSFFLISIIMFQFGSGNNLSTNTSDYSSQLFTENSKSYVMTYIVLILLTLFFIINLLLCRYSIWTINHLKI